MDTAHIKETIEGNSEQQIPTNVQKELRNVLYIRSACINMCQNFKSADILHIPHPSGVWRKL